MDVYLCAMEATDRVAAEMHDGDDKVEALRCADEDVQEAHAYFVFEDTTWYLSYISERPLFLLLGMLYFGRIPRKDWLDGMPSPREHLDCLLDFTAALEAASFDDYNQQQDADDAIEELWCKHCASRRYRVSFQEKPWKIDRKVPRRPLRVPEHPLAFDSATYRPREFASELVKSEPDCGRDRDIPQFFTIVSEVMVSECSIARPSRLQGIARSKLLTFLSDRHPVYEELSNVVEALYREIEGRGMSYLPTYEEEQEDEPAYPLTVGEVTNILRAIEGNRLCRSLFVERPPRSILPHALAVQTCAEHARLWLARVDLRIYYNLELKYAELCTQEAREAEEEALEQGFQLERRPSCVEGYLRTRTLLKIWSSAERVVNFRPEDYELVPVSMPYDKCLRKLGYPFRASECGKVDLGICSSPGERWIVPPYHLSYEDRSKLDWLLREDIPAGDAARCIPAGAKKKSFNQIKPWVNLTRSFTTLARFIKV